MIDWQDSGTLLTRRPYGESALIVQVLTAAHGLHAGVVRGGASRKMSGTLQPGARLSLRWSARLEAHLGHFTVDPMGDRAGALLGDRKALAALNAVCALSAFALPEREAMPRLASETEALLDALGAPDWQGVYLRWERVLLEETGFGLDLSSCAVTGAQAGLAYVSPRSGRAVTAAGAGAWADRLLPLPQALLEPVAASPEEIAAGLRTTGHFLARWLAPALGDRPLPEARARLVALLSA